MGSFRMAVAGGMFKYVRDRLWTVCLRPPAVTRLLDLTLHAGEDAQVQKQEATPGAKWKQQFPRSGLDRAGLGTLWFVTVLLTPC
jgi:hypothetical protein